jgi:hypothetical protein
MTKHAILSASGSKRWMNCPGSVQAEAAVPHGDRRSSPAARQGTAAHALLEFCLREGNVRADDMLGWRIGVPLDESDHPDPVMIPSDSKAGLNPKAFDVYEVDEDMAGSVQVALDFVAEVTAELDDAELTPERSYDLSWVRPGMFGTADITISEEFGTLVIADYKHGKGVPVPIRESDGSLNSQAMYYGAGAAHEAGWTHERAVLAIIQPRCPDVPTVQVEEVPVSELKRWAETTLRDAAVLTEDDDAVRQAGDWCKWCGAQHSCPEIREKALQAAGADFDGVVEDLPVPTELGQLSKALKWVPAIDAWVKAVNAAAQAALERGQDVPDFKLVRKRSQRRFKQELSEEQVIRELVRMTRGEAKKADLVITKPKTLGALEKLGPKTKAAVAALTEKPEGGLTVAASTDKRPAVVPQLTSDFDGIREDEDAAE